MHPPQMQMPNFGIPMQPWVRILDQQLEGFNLPYSHDIPAPMTYCDQNQMHKANSLRNFSDSYHGQNFNSFTNKKAYNRSYAYNCQVHAVEGESLLDSPLPLNGMWQLLGNFEVEKSDLKLKVSLMKDEQEGRVYSSVQRICVGVEVLAYQYILEEETQFKLCSQDGCVEAVIMKGTNINNCVTWTSLSWGKTIVWKRITANNCKSASISKSIQESDSLRSFPLSLTSDSQDCQDVCSVNDFTNTNQDTSADVPGVSQQDNILFERMKAQCNSDPWLKEKVVEWCNSCSSKSSPRENALKLSKGRLWISVRSLLTEGEDESFQDDLDHLNGAYQEFESGVYNQPMSKSGDKYNIHHRLLKGSEGLWLLEKYDFEEGVWAARIQEHPDGSWLDLDTSRKIHVTLIPLLRILENLRERGFAFDDLEKNLNFLFNSCNQKKLSRKYRTRNGKHNIANLKAKLAKLHALKFSIIVARTADSIAFKNEN